MTDPAVDETHEARRIQVLRALDLIDHAPREQLNTLAALAARLVEAPIGVVTLIDRHEQHLIGRYGIQLGTGPRRDSFCQHTIGQDRPLIVANALNDPRFANLPAVVAADVRFYAGVPISASAHGIGRAVIGALCVLDPEPRTLDHEQQASLAALAEVAEKVIEARSTARDALVLAQQAHEQAVALQQKDRIIQQAERLAMIGAWRFRPQSPTLEWTDGVRHIHEVDADFVPTMESALDFYPPHARAMVSDAIERTLRTGEPIDFETDFVTSRGRPLRVRCLGEVERGADGRTMVTGMIQDVTTRWQLEQQLRRSAHVDSLTGIANRAGFNDRLIEALARARDRGTPLALVLIDLDGFKRVNDTHGHVAGDDVLRAYGQRLRADWLADTFPARLGGDEFALIVEGAATRDLPLRIARLLDHLARPIPLEGQMLKCPGSIGWARFESDMERVRDLVHAADTALYKAKRERRGAARAVNE